jgi:hypothetical protein
VFDYGYNHAKRISPQPTYIPDATHIAEATSVTITNKLKGVHDKSSTDFTHVLDTSDNMLTTDFQGGKKPYILSFPEPKIIYLFSNQPIPKEYTLRLSFGTQGYFDYKVTTFDYLKTSIEELNRKKMVILIPFELLRLRESLKKERTPENLEQLINLIQNDIIGSINENLRVGNITPSDARHLQQLTQKLYEHLYAHYEELEAISDMTDQSLVLDIDIIEREHERELRQKDKIIAEKDDTLLKKDTALAEMSTALDEMSTVLEEQAKEIEHLRALLKEKQTQ